MNDSHTYEQISNLCGEVALESFQRRLRQDIEQLFRPTLELLLRPENCLLEILRAQDSRHLLNSFQNNLHEISIHNLRPWRRPSTCANRKTIKGECGLEIILKIYSRILEVPIPPWNSRDVSLQRVEIRILYFLWNFCETKAERNLAVEMGAFDMMLQSLMHSEEEFCDKYTINGLCYVAVGCLSK